MGLRLVLGRAGSGKSKLCQEEIVRELKERPDGYPLIYIVPEQATFQEEYALTTAPGLGGTIRAQVLSFRRLAWKVMQEVGGGKRFFIDDTGKGMVLRKVLEKQRGRLRVFRHAGEQAGALENLVQLYNELKRSCIPVSLLREIFQKRVDAGGADLPSLFQEKMSDLLLILEEAEKELAGLYIDTEDYLNLLAELLPRSVYITGAEVWVDGFYGFTNQEYAVLEGLLGRCRGVTVTASLDRFRSSEEVLDELDPFYPAALTCRKLQQLADRCRVPLEKVILGKGFLPRFTGNPELAHLEQKLHSYPAIPYNGEISCLTLAAAPNRRCEVESLAREMIRRSRDEGYRWRDMAVIVSELDEYRDTLTTVFGDYHIPFFLDQKRPVIHHPLVEFIRSSMEVANRSWRYDAVFRCIKTEFLLPAAGDENLRRYWRERADRLANYVLACGIQGKLWLQDDPWEYLVRDTLEEEGDEGEKLSAGEQAFLQQINETRRKVSEPLLHFQENFRQAATVKEKTAALYGLLQEAGVWERLESWSEEALEKGDAERAREHLQVYRGIVELMDQLAEIMGEEKISSALYARILETGMESLRLSMVPPSLDQVLVGNVERSRSGHVRLVYLLGVNDGALPSRPREDGIFSEEERETIRNWGLDSAPGSRRRLLDEQFLIYMVLTRASSGLWISYPLADEEGRALLPSTLVARLKQIFPSLEETLLSGEPDGEHAADVDNVDSDDGVDNVGNVHLDLDEKVLGVKVDASNISADIFEAAGNDAVTASAMDIVIDMEADRDVGADAGDADLAAAYLLHYIATPRRTLSHLSVQLGRLKKGAGMHPLWWDVYNWFARREGWREPGKRLLGGIFHENRERPLRPETGLELYGKHLRASVSRLERFRSCPFSHFVSHGLRLKERRIYRLEAPDIGRFFHAALHNFAVSLEELGLEWGETGSEECLRLVHREVERLLPRLQKEILLSSSRYRYLALKLRNTVARTVLVLSEHARRSSFKPVGLELSFGTPGTPGVPGGLPALVLGLDNGCKVEMAGRIDRVDLAHDDEGKAYLRVIDYKSGRTDLKLPDIYYGLSMQMLVYLDILLTHALQWLQEEALPAGVLYFRVHTPVINLDEYLPREKIESAIRRCYKMKGKVLEDVNVVRLMDNLLERGYSEIIPAGLTKDGAFYKNSATLSGRRFTLLRGHTRSLIRESALNIMGGRVDIAPYRLGGYKACTYCLYKAVCQFDPLLETNDYRVLKREDDEQIWHRLQRNIEKPDSIEGPNSIEGPDSRGGNEDDR